jgi:hypothetical protein
MTSTAEITRSLQSALAGSIPIVLIDMTALDTAAVAVRRAGHRIADALVDVHHSWRDLPAVVEAPGAVEPLYSAMAGSLAASTTRIAALLERYADQAATAKGTFGDLRTRCEALLSRSNDELAEQHTIVTTYGTAVELPASSGLVAAHIAFVTDLHDEVAAWSKTQGSIANELRALRDGLDPDLLVGPAAATTDGFINGPDRFPITGMTDADAGATSVPFDGMQLGMVWLLGAGPRNLVLGNNSGFAKRLSASETVAAARRIVRERLSAGIAPLGTDIPVPGRSLSGAGGVGVYATDGLKTLLYAATLGGVDAGVDDSFLGSYDLSVAPIAAAGARRTVVRFTITNSTTLASGTRVPLIGYGAGGQQIDDVKNHLVPSGPASELTQTITWTEVVSWPPHKRSDLSER